MGADRILPDQSPTEADLTRERVRVDGMRFLQAVLQTTFTAGEPGTPFDIMSLSLHNGNLILEASDGTSFARSSVPASVALSSPVTTVAASEMTRTARAFLEDREQTVNLVTDSDSNLQITSDCSDTTIILGTRDTAVDVPSTDGLSDPRMQFRRDHVAACTRRITKSMENVFRDKTFVFRTVQRDLQWMPLTIDLFLRLDTEGGREILVANEVIIGDLQSAISIPSNLLLGLVFTIDDVDTLNFGLNLESNMVIFEKPDESFLCMTSMVKTE